jgi:hypothetical protein
MSELFLPRISQLSILKAKVRDLTSQRDELIKQFSRLKQLVEHSKKQELLIKDLQTEVLNLRALLK